ncbi:MAG TPA: hypothetical protein VFJ62_07375, partial [Usitatibacter sp.]|nr:hypothetical protein [Usitatibacter sp.]
MAKKSDHALIEDGGAAAAPDEHFEEHGKQRALSGFALRVLMGAALAFSIYQLVIAAFSPLSSQVTRSLHVGFLLLLTFLLYPVSKRADGTRVAWYDWIVALGAVALGFYHWIFEADLIQRSGEPT